MATKFTSSVKKIQPIYHGANQDQTIFASQPVFLLEKKRLDYMLKVELKKLLSRLLQKTTLLFL